MPCNTALDFFIHVHVNIESRQVYPPASLEQCIWVLASTYFPDFHYSKYKVCSAVVIHLYLISIFIVIGRRRRDYNAYHVTL